MCSVLRLRLEAPHQARPSLHHQQKVEERIGRRRQHCNQYKQYATTTEFLGVCPYQGFREMTLTGHVRSHTVQCFAGARVGANHRTLNPTIFKHV